MKNIHFSPKTAVDTVPNERRKKPSLKFNKLQITSFLPLLRELYRTTRYIYFSSRLLIFFKKCLEYFFRIFEK